MKNLAFALIGIMFFSIIATSNNAFAVEEKMTITSQAFKDSGTIPKKYSCEGKNISPPLQFKNIPKNTKTLALIMDDPDAPIGTFNHWIAWGITPKKHQISEGEKGKISEGMNGLGQKGYFGPCPPTGTHRYYFKLYALDSDIDISEKSKKKELQVAIDKHVIQSAILLGKYAKTGN